MKKILTIILIALSFGAFSQIKLGHINTEELLNLMPELDAAQQQLQREVTQHQEVVQTLQTELRNLYAEYEANQNQWSDLIKATKVRAIQDLDSRLQGYSQDAEKDLAEQQKKLFNPVIEKAKQAITDVAKENKYTYVFDTSQGVLLYSSESDDIMELVKKKLNLK
jgi:outer membrane protein